MGYYEAAVAQIAHEQLTAALICPSCGEQNRKGRLAMVELDARGGAFCNSCSYSWSQQSADLSKGIDR